MTERTEDEIKFGSGRYVYCKSHLRPHTTGWCTVNPEDKILLDATDRDGAYSEVRAKGWKIYGEEG